MANLPSLILHQYEMSPFAQKLRRILAFKGLAYRAVRAPAVMPKPDLIALTGGYRKIPVLQIDNHVYCDTSLQARLLERLQPTPTLYPHPLAQSFAEWADSSLFDATVSIALRPTRLDDILKWFTHDEMTKFGDDRRAMGDGARRVPPPGRVARTHLATYFGRLESALQIQANVFGDVMSIADFSVYHSVWFVRSLAPDVVAPYAKLLAWADRIAAIPDPEITAFTSAEALALCKQSPSDWQPATPFNDPQGLKQGQRIVIRTLDYGRDPIEGELVDSNLDEIAISRQDDRAGQVFVHFPRIGYEIKPAVG